MVGFLDGINDSLKTPNPIETMKEDTEVSLAFDKEKLYKNMVGAKADWLYNLPHWDDIFDKDKQIFCHVSLSQAAEGARRKSSDMRAQLLISIPAGQGMQ